MASIVDGISTSVSRRYCIDVQMALYSYHNLTVTHMQCTIPGITYVYQVRMIREILPAPALWFVADITKTNSSREKCKVLYGVGGHRPQSPAASPPPLYSLCSGPPLPLLPERRPHLYSSFHPSSPIPQILVVFQYQPI